VTVVSCGLTVTTTEPAPPTSRSGPAFLPRSRALGTARGRRRRSGGRRRGGSVLLVRLPAGARGRRTARGRTAAADHGRRSSARRSGSRRSGGSVRSGSHSHGPRDRATSSGPGSTARAPTKMVGLTPQVATRLRSWRSLEKSLPAGHPAAHPRRALGPEPAGEHRLPELSRAIPVLPVSGELRPHASSLDPARPRDAARRAAPAARSSSSTPGGGMQAAAAGLGARHRRPGIGKSRLVRELHRRVPADIWFEARCVRGATGQPAPPVADMIAALGEPLESMLRRRGSNPAETLPRSPPRSRCPFDHAGRAPSSHQSARRSSPSTALLRLLIRRGGGPAGWWRSRTSTGPTRRRSRCSR